MVTNRKKSGGKTTSGKKRRKNATIYPNPVTQSSPLRMGTSVLAIIAVLAGIAAFITPAGNGFIDLFNLHGLYAGLTWILTGSLSGIMSRSLPLYFSASLIACISSGELSDMLAIVWC